jgi:hypothetical protein
VKRARFSLPLFFLLACGEGPGKSWLVDRPRVLGARTEPTSVTWLVASAPKQVGWAFAACPAPPGNYASIRCEGELVASASGTANDTELVAMETGALPPKTLVLAAFCADGPATLAPRDFTATCASGAEALLASVETGIQDNRAPAIADDAITIASGCGGPFVVRLDDSMRDPGESLLLAHFVSSGELDRTYSTLEASEGAPKTVEVPWTAPADARDVKVYFVLRDGRGGTAFATRTICKREP